MPSAYTSKEVRELAKKAIDFIEQDDESEFFQITEQLLLSKSPFRLLYIYGTEIGRQGLKEPEKYLQILDELFKKSVNYGCDQEQFKSNPKFWTEDNIRAMVLGARMAIITTCLAMIGEKYPKKVIPIIKRYLIDGDGWYICDGMSIALGRILNAHFETTLPVVKTWVKAENHWLRRASVVSLLELMRNRSPQLHEAMVVFDLLMKDTDWYVKKGVSWMLRELSKKNRKEMIGLVNKWLKEKDRNTRLIIKNGIKKLTLNEQKEILRGYD